MYINRSRANDKMATGESDRRVSDCSNSPDHLRSLSHHPNLTTSQLATELGLSPQSIRKRYSQTGSYFQLRPVKLPNGRLLWPADAIEQLIRYKSVDDGKLISCQLNIASRQEGE